MSDAAPTTEPAVTLNQTGGANTKPTQSQRPGGKKRKVALFLGYVGKGYQGMQRQPGSIKTIEDDLEAAIARAGGISADNANSFTKVHWARAARTDKGVSAMGQVVSLNMMIGYEDIVQRINEQLPSQVRIFGFYRTTKGFDARTWCDYRRYEYILPEWAFDPTVCVGKNWEQYFSTPKQEGQSTAAATAEAGAQPDASMADADAVQDAAGTSAAAASATPAAAELPTEVARTAGAAAASEDGDEGGAPNVPSDGEGEVEGEAEAEEVSALPQATPLPEPIHSTFVFGEEDKARLNRLLAFYQGTHNFHNFTVRMPAKNMQAMRHMRKLWCDGIFEVNGQRWVRLVVIGQSFMLHQIRKMVGMILAVMRNVASEACLRLALSPEYNVHVPMAPALGLYLAECFYEAYNKRFGSQHGTLSMEPFRDQGEAMKLEKLYPEIAREDEASGTFANFLRCLNDANFRFSTWHTLPKNSYTPRGDGRKRTAPDASGNGSANKRPRRQQAEPAAAELPPAAASDRTPAEGEPAVLEICASAFVAYDVEAEASAAVVGAGAVASGAGLVDSAAAAVANPLASVAAEGVAIAGAVVEQAPDNLSGAVQ